MKTFQITVGTGPDDERNQYMDVEVIQDPEEFDGDVRGEFKPEPMKINVDEDGNETERIPERIGKLRLLRDELGAGYVTHELTHALSWYCELLPFTDPFATEESEEIIAWELGEWHRQFWEKWREIKNE